METSIRLGIFLAFGLVLLILAYLTVWQRRIHFVWPLIVALVLLCAFYLFDTGKLDAVLRKAPEERETQVAEAAKTVQGMREEVGKLRCDLLRLVLDHLAVTKRLFAGQGAQGATQEEQESVRNEIDAYATHLQHQYDEVRCP